MTTTTKRDWEVVLSVINPTTDKTSYGYGRPRRLSLHTIAEMVGRDAATVLVEMKESGKVVGYVCPDVRTPIFYLKDSAKLPNMIDTRNEAVWTAAAQKIVDFPPATVKGFRRFAGTKKYEMDVPFEEEDKPYEAAIKAALSAAGF